MIENTSNREKALRMAVELETCRNKEDAKYDVLATANGFLDFLDGVQNAVPTSAADPTPAAPRKRRGSTTAASATDVENSAAAPAPVVSAPATAPAAGSALPAEQPKAAATPSKAPTLDDVRTALVQLQSRTGTREKSQKILDKYTPNAAHVTGSLKAEDYVRVISECAA